MKTLKAICERLEPKYRPLLDAYRFEGEVFEDVLSYQDFTSLMMEGGWILSEKTIRSKWQLLQVNGVIQEYARDKAFILVKGLAKVLGYTPYVEEKKIKKNFSAKAGAEEASQ